MKENDSLFDEIVNETGEAITAATDAVTDAAKATYDSITSLPIRDVLLFGIGGALIKRAFFD